MMPTHTASRSRGFTMLEVLIAILVTSIGLLGVAGMQAFALKNTHSASLRLTASMLATDMIDRTHANKSGSRYGWYDKPALAAYTTAVASCLTAAGCTAQELASNDLNEWSQRVAASLPNGTGIVCYDSTPNDGVSSAAPDCDGNGIYVVKIWWSDDRNGNVATPQRFSSAFNP
jgi:type IV pilus assembly protein PilV